MPTPSCPPASRGQLPFTRTLRVRLLLSTAAIRGPAEPGDVVSTLGGVVESLLVTAGQQVGEGERVVVIEAMKMKTPITAHKAGKVDAVLVKVGDGVQTGQVLLKLS